MIVALVISSAGCSLTRPQKAHERSDKVNKRINKKHQKEYQEAREKFIEKHYERQPQNVQKWMDYNARQAEQWRNQNMKEEKPSIFERIGDWFEDVIEWFDRPDEGLYR